MDFPSIRGCGVCTTRFFWEHPADVFSLSIAGASMECGSSDVFCQLANWLAENDLAASGITELIGKLGEDAQGATGAISRFVKDYGQAIVGLFGLSFGFYRWWLYREHILHKRLAEYIGSRDARLKGAREQAMETIQRPAPGQAFRAPLFISWELRSVLRETRWDNSAVALSVETSADWQLDRAIQSIMSKLHTAEREAVCLRQELCTAYSLRGAIASSGSRDGLGVIALSHFRNALSLPGHDSDLVIRELEAHQLRKLGHFDAARAAYERVFQLADSVALTHDRDVLKARAKRYLAEIESLEYPKNAYLMLTTELVGKDYSPGALALLEACEPLGAWELVEKGDIHYFGAFLARGLEFSRAEPAQLEAAATSYETALLSLRRQRWQFGKSTSRFRKRIMDGRARVETAQATGIYDTEWLPKSQQTQQPASDVGAASG